MSCHSCTFLSYNQEKTCMVVHRISSFHICLELTTLLEQHISTRSLQPHRVNCCKAPFPWMQQYSHQEVSNHNYCYHKQHSNPFGPVTKTRKKTEKMHLQWFKNIVHFGVTSAHNQTNYKLLKEMMNRLFTWP